MVFVVDILHLDYLNYPPKLGPKQIMQLKQKYVLTFNSNWILVSSLPAENLPSISHGFIHFVY